MTIGALYKEFLTSSGVTTDSRTAGKEQIFFALRGENFDGNRYIDEALERGCRFAVSDHPGMEERENVTVVADVLIALQELALHHRRQWGGKVLAITGSNGKTTTRELVNAVLSEKYRVLSTQGNLNNHIGVPLTLLELADQEIGVIEMGANHAGEIAKLCRIAEPDAGIITNIGKAHLEGFGSLEGVKKAKGELYDHLEKNGGTAIVDLSDPILSEMAGSRNLEVFSYGEGDGYDVDGAPVASKGEAGIDVTFSIHQKSYKTSSVLFGSYNMKNILAAAATGTWLGVVPDKIVAAVSRYIPDNNRSQLARGRTNTLILDAYNANPSSVAGAVREFEQMDHPDKVLILGDMYETGSDEEHEHRALLQHLAGSDIGKVMLVGKRFGQFSGDPKFPFQFFGDVEECLGSLREDPPRNSLVMLKGSRKNALEKATNFLLDC